LRGGLTIWIPHDEKNQNRFWKFYTRLEATSAWTVLALVKFAKKGDETKLLVIPDTKEAINEALEAAGEPREGQIILYE
jgi:hypothetical protein